MVLDAVGEMGHVELGRRLHQLVEPVEPAPHVGKLRLDGLQPLALIAGHVVHLLVHHVDQAPDVALGQDVGADQPDYQLLELTGVHPGRVAGAWGALHEGVADVVGKGAPAGVAARERPPAPVALDQAAQQEGASHPAGVGVPGGAGAHYPVHPVELVPGDGGGERALHPHRVCTVAGVVAPYEGSQVRFVSEDVVDGGLVPELPPGALDALVVEDADYLHHPLAGLGQVEDALDDAVGFGVGLEGGPLLGAVLDLDLPVAVGCHGSDPEAAGRRLPHAPQDLHPKIFRVKLVHGLDDALKQPAGGVVLGLLGDGDDAEALSSEHGLEHDGVLPLAGESTEFPDQNLLKRGLGSLGLVDHLLELWAVQHASALRLVHVLPDDLVAVLLGVVPERPELGGDGQVHVLSVAGNPSVEGHGRAVGLFGLAAHVCVLLFHLLLFLRASARCRRSWMRHSLSSMYRRMASRRSSLTVRCSSLTTCRTCWASSGGREKVMVSVVLGMVGIIPFFACRDIAQSYSYHERIRPPSQGSRPCIGQSKQGKIGARYVYAEAHPVGGIQAVSVEAAAAGDHGRWPGGYAARVQRRRGAGAAGHRGRLPPLQLHQRRR